jgi:hypothetical protein
MPDTRLSRDALRDVSSCRANHSTAALSPCGRRATAPTPPRLATAADDERACAPMLGPRSQSAKSRRDSLPSPQAIAC